MNHRKSRLAYFSFPVALLALSACATDNLTPIDNGENNGNNGVNNGTVINNSGINNSGNNIPVLPNLPASPPPPPVEVPIAQPVTQPSTNVVAPPAANEDLIFNRGNYATLPNWSQTDVGAARLAFINSCNLFEKRDGSRFLGDKIAYAGRVSAWLGACAKARSTNIDDREFWEGNFTPWRLTSSLGGRGKLTSYFEPILRASFSQTSVYNEPLYGKPSDLITLDLAQFDPSLAGKKIVGRITGRDFIPYRSRAEINSNNAPIVAWAKMGEALSLQIQGSGRLIMQDGRQYKAAFNSHNGKPFGSVARELIKRGELSQSQASADNITKWFETASSKDARDVINANPRTVFFDIQQITNPNEGPKGAQGVPLVANGSVAVDPSYHAYGVPIFVRADTPKLGNSYQSQLTRLVIAQDTGGAIKGPIRGDLFYGTGDEAGQQAGRINHDADWWILLPNNIDPTKAK